MAFTHLVLGLTGSFSQCLIGLLVAILVGRVVPPTLPHLAFRRMLFTLSGRGHLNPGRFIFVTTLQYGPSSSWHLHLFLHFLDFTFLTLTSLSSLFSPPPPPHASFLRHFLV